MNASEHKAEMMKLIRGLSPEDRMLVYAIADAFRTVLKNHAEHAQIALALVGAEVNEKIEETL